MVMLCFYPSDFFGATENNFLWLWIRSLVEVFVYLFLIQLKKKTIRSVTFYSKTGGLLVEKIC